MANGFESKNKPGMGDVYGGLAGAIVGLAQLLTLGVLGFGALGPQYASLGVQGAFNSAVFGALAAALIGGTAIPAAGPRAATTLIFATFVATLVARPEFHAADGTLQVGPILLLASLCVILAGVFLLIFGCMRLGSLVRFVPYPVIAGFMNGIAVLLVLSQIPYLLGTNAVQYAKEGFNWEKILPGAGVVALITAGIIWLCARHFRRIPITLIALVVGALAHQLIALGWPGIVGSVLGAAPSTLDMVSSLKWWLRLYPDLQALLSTHGLALLTTAWLIAVVGALDSLLAAAAADIAQDTRHQPNRELIGEGVGNIVAGILGGIPIQFSAARSLAAYRAGARTWLSGFVTPAVLLLALLLGGPLFAFIPLAALAGVMLTVSTGMIDRWSSGLVRHLVRMHSADASGSLWVVVLVCIITVVFGFLPAIGVGIILVMVLFIRAMNRSMVRAVWTGATRSSRRMYPARYAQYLRSVGHRTKILELDGPLFFGTAEKLSDSVESHVNDIDFLILDLRRVSSVDATGAVVLQRLDRRMKERDCQLLLAHVTPAGQVGKSLDVFGAFKGDARERWYEDTDRALEAVEMITLGREPRTELVRPFSLHECSLFRGLNEQESHALSSYLQRLNLRAGEVLFREGDPGDRLYLLTSGMVSLMSTAGRGQHRIASFEAGVMFGELAMLDGGARSAMAIANQNSELYTLSRESLGKLTALDPVLANKLRENLAHHLAQRLRLTTDAMRMVVDAGD